jgi:hypothetical protein
MWRDDRQCARACRALLGVLHLEHYWTEEGPTDEAVIVVNDLAAGRGSVLSTSETILLRAAMSFSTGNRCGLDFADVVDRLGNDALRAVCSLGVALAESGTSPGAIDHWLLKYERGREN